MEYREYHYLCAKRDFSLRLFMHQHGSSTLDVVGFLVFSCRLGLTALHRYMRRHVAFFSNLDGYVMYGVQMF